MHSIIEYDDGTAFETDLISLAALKLALDITSDTEDARLAALIERDSLLIADYCGRRFAFSDAVETFRFDTCEQWSGPLCLSLRPVSEIESVTIGGTEIAVEDYELDAARGLLWLAGGSWQGVVVVTYSGGYALPDDAPSALASAIIESVRFRRVASAVDPAVSSVAHGDTRVSYFQQGPSASTGGLSRLVVDLIDQFRQPPLA